MKPDLCSFDQLNALLNGTLADQDESAMADHLSRCDRCVQELERQAADHSRWNDAQRFLKDPPEVENQDTSLANSDQKLPLSVRQVLGLLDPTDDPKCLGRIGGYEVTGVVGSGAMGVVLKATDRTLDRIVALKVMNPSLAECGTARQRFAREAKAAAGILHPNVIAIHSVSTDHILPYLVMPYVKGASLQQRLNRQGPLSLPEILRFGSQVAGGLAAAHHQGLIHRDIKPSNIMLDFGVETAVITDFGLARTMHDATMTRSGAITGTPEFMSPEQARGESIDLSSDVFSLGSVLYALCTGQRPFRAKTSFGVLRKITDETPPSIREINPEIPQWFCSLVNRMHAKSPAARPSAVEVRDLLERCLAHVYQPDRISLPNQLSTPVGSQSVFFTRPFKLGALIIMTIAILALLFAFYPSNAFSPGASDDSPNQKLTADDPAVFKTLNLAFAAPDKKGTLVIDINRGFIDVAGHDRDDVIIEILNPMAPPESGKEEGSLRSRFAPKFDLEQDKAKNSIKLDTYNQSYALNLRVKVPYETDLDLDTYYDGYLQVKNVTGIIETRSQNCDIRLLDIAGAATAYGYNGDITGRFRRLAINANVDFESYNGSIDLTLPASTAATTAISAGIGNYYSAFDVEAVSNHDLQPTQFSEIKNRIGKYEFGKINGGGIPMRIESEKGKIELRKAARSEP